MTDSLAPNAVEPLLRGRFGRPYVYAERRESTQLLLDPSMAEGATAVCEEQTAGRGRLGRTWKAPAGTAILCSVLLKPPRGRRIQELSLVGGVATAIAVEQALDLAAQIKWPNDVMVRRAKIAGVLAEAREGAVILGIGVNVNQTRGQLPPGAASLRTVDGLEHERAPILASLLDGLGRRYGEWLEEGLDAVYEGLAPRDFLRGRRVSVNGTSGTAVKIDREGRLEIAVGHGEVRTVESGEVLYER